MSSARIRDSSTLPRAIGGASVTSWNLTQIGLAFQVTGRCSDSIQHQPQKLKVLRNAYLIGVTCFRLLAPKHHHLSGLGIEDTGTQQGGHSETSWINVHGIHRAMQNHGSMLAILPNVRSGVSKIFPNQVNGRNQPYNGCCQGLAKF